MAGCSKEEESAPKLGVVEVTSTELSARTIDYLQEHRAELKMRAPRQELVSVRMLKDDLAMTHVRMRQVERGVRVIGGNATVHYDAAGGISAVRQQYVPDLDRLDVIPTIDAAKAKTLITESGGGEVITEPELVIFAFDHHAPTLSWEMSVRTSPSKSWLVTMDAHTGEIIDRITQQHSLKGTGVGVLGKTRDIEYTQTNGQFQLVDATRAFTLTTLDAKQNADARRGTVLLGASANSWDTTSRLGKGSGVDAQANIALVVDYYSKKFGRKSWDDKNGAVPMVVHVGDDQDGQPGLDNAYFDQINKLMAFGDGREILKPTAGFLDITAHEFTHAVTFFSSNLRYENQSGALNESVSDIFAAFIEHSAAPNDKNNWAMGEGSMLDPSTPIMRDMINPEKGATPQPGHMSEFERTTADAGGVHINSGIPNKAAQLMTIGGNSSVSKVTVPRGIGWENAEKVWYRANTVYLTETSDFGAAAQATLSAAKDLQLDQDDQNVIDCAWKAVGVLQGECAKISPKSTTPAPNGGVDAPSTETPGDTTTTGDRSGDDDDSATTDDDEPAKKKKKTTKKKSTGNATAEEAQGCSTVAPGADGGAWTWLLAAGAVVVARRRRRSM